MRLPARILTLLSAAALIGVMPLPATADEETVTYVAGPGLCCGEEVGSQLAVGIGGYLFTPRKDPKFIKVEDSNGPGIVWIACQENPDQEGEQPSTCGDGDDASAGGCSTGKFQRLDDRFQPRTELRVFVLMSNPGVFVGPECEQIGTTGTITLRF